MRVVGKGFAVVASEVRGLASRSAEAAKEIRALLSTSGKQVAAGVKRVSEINAAVGQLDRTTQQNAAMVEEATAAARRLETETRTLADLVQQFQVAPASRGEGAAPPDPFATGALTP